MSLIVWLLDIYTLGLLVYVILTWIQSPGAVKARTWLARFYEPLLKPLRGLLESIKLGGSSFDLSPLLLFILIILVRRLLFSY